MSCTEKVETGSLLVDFGGVEGVEILSPTSARIHWQLHKRYKEYDVYNNLSDEPILTTQFSEVVLNNLNPEESYTFKVVARNGEDLAGADKELRITMWKPFAGVESAALGTENSITVSWTYPNQVEQYYIYYKKYEDPTSTNTNSWNEYSASTMDTKHTFVNLEGSTRYHFVVQAKYKDGTYERVTKSVTASTTSSFPEPVFSLSPISIGSLPYATVTPVSNVQYRTENYTSRLYRDGQPISDPLVGKGTLVFSSSANLPLGKVDNVSLQVTYKDNSINETRIFDGLSTYIKGVASTQESPPIQGDSGGVAYMGEAMTTGDFNCDGAADLAVGLPNISIASLGIKSSKAGAVYVYYSKKDSDNIHRLKTTPAPSLNPAVPGTDPQIITFDDLTENAQFGYSLAGQGNLNGDSNLGKECQDLLVGAPGYTTGAGREYDGASFVFFGSVSGLKVPAHIKDMQQNIETCDGVIEGATCSAVMLWPNMNLYPASRFDVTTYPTITTNTNERFGHAVSYIGDFNADGFDDLAIGAPYAPWDGVANQSLPPESRYLMDVGYVALFFGSTNGIGTENPEAPAVTNLKLRFLKIFPPIPTEGMKFGWSIAGGADVDGRYRVKRNDGALVGGADMVIGAPGFSYPDPSDPNFKLPIGGACPGECASVTPAEGGWWGASFLSAGTNAYGIPMNRNYSTSLSVNPGVAFLYFGRGGTTAPGSTDYEIPTRSNFWQCGKRKMLPTEHYSCLVSEQSFRTLFPRSDYKNGLVNRAFGSSVAILGDPSRFDETNSERDPLTFTDSNGDGWADVAVGTGYFSNGPTKANSGAVWLFHGNKDRFFEFNAFAKLNGSNYDTDWQDSMPSCSSFDSAAKKAQCAPTVLRSNSIGADSLLGLHPQAIAVADLSGDGLKDIAVGATGDATKGVSSGAAYVFTSYKGKGITSNFLKFYNGEGLEYDQFGRSLALGNFDGDTYTNNNPIHDIAVGAFMDRSKKPGGGAVYGFVSDGQSLPAVNQVFDFKMVDELGSMQAFGYESATFVGDINGDGYDDAVVKISKSHPNSTSYLTDAVIFYGSQLGLITTSFCLESKSRIFKEGMDSDLYCYPSSTAPVGVTKNEIVLPQLLPRPSTVSIAWALRAFPAGDVNKDGFADVMFLDPYSGGQATLYFGSRSGIQAVNNPSWLPAVGDPQIVTKRWSQMSVDGSGAWTYWHREMIYNGDFNGDGYSDLVFADPYESSKFYMNVNGGLEQGNSPAGTSPGVNQGWQCTPQKDQSCKDGVPAQNMGFVVILYGSATGVQTPKMKGYSGPGDEPDVNFIDPASVSTYLLDTYGTEGAVAANKGCTGSPQNNCRVQYLYSPVILNVNYGYARMQHQFGAGVAVMKNGDYDDLYISAPGWEDVSCYYDTPNARANYGRIFIYRGGPNGVEAAVRDDYYSPYQAGTCVSDRGFQDADNTLNGNGGSGLGATGVTRALMPPIFSSHFYNQSARQFGSRLTSAGDLNNDGYEDLIVTAHNESPDANRRQAGVSYVYYGPICGTDNAGPLWDYLRLNFNKQLEFSDPALGLTPLNACQRSTGSGTGTAKPAPQVFAVKDAVTDDFYGITIMSGRAKGDFNLDGYDDVVIGGYGWDDALNSNSDYGRGVVFFGSQKGLFTDEVPDAVVVADEQGRVKPFAIKGKDNEPGARYFYSNTSTGDVNGDGTMDLMVPSRNHSGFGNKKGIYTGTFFLLF